MICTILIISFFLEAIYTNIVSIDSLFIPLFAFTSLILIYPYFNKKDINYVIVCLILGLFYDIVFSDSAFVNTMCFAVLGTINIICNKYVKYNIYTSNIINLILIITYRIISYVMLLSINYVVFNSYIFFKGIYSSLIVNFLYGIVLYLIIELIAKIFNKKRVE